MKSRPHRFHHIQNQGTIIEHPAQSRRGAGPLAAAAQPHGADAEVLASLKKVLASKQFSKAHRCASLLSYLMHHALLHGAGRAPSEHDIGVAVFGRDRGTYFTGDDPIVRVQAGRLRLRLAAYYAEEGCADALRISIPLGSYQARVERISSAAPPVLAGPAPLLLFRPLACLGEAPLLTAYGSGLSDELGYRLYRSLTAIRRIDPEMALATLAPPPGARLLEGTVRQDAARVRVSLLLRNVGDSAVLWYEQFDAAFSASFAAQEGMAERCLQALRQYLAT